MYPHEIVSLTPVVAYLNRYRSPKIIIGNSILKKTTVAPFTNMD